MDRQRPVTTATTAGIILFLTLLLGLTPPVSGQYRTPFGVATNSPFVELRSRNPSPDVVAGLDPNRGYQDDLTALHAACYWGDVETAKALLAKGADPARRCKYQQTALHYAVFTNECEQDWDSLPRKVALCRLLLRKSDPNAQDVMGDTPLHLAVSGRPWGGRRFTAEIIQITEDLLNAGARVDTTNNLGQTVLFVAVDQQIDGEGTALYELLLRHGADPNRPDNSGMSPLYSAVKCGLRHTCECLLKHGGNIATIGPDGVPLLIEAVRNNDHDTVRVLLAHKADVNWRDADGNTVLHIVREPKVCRLLLLAGADLNARNQEGQTPLAAARSHRYPKLVKYLEGIQAR